ncbi:hypothetical protein G432_20570 (plasmid) [Sphingomonas sp. MM-1]|uniref:DUF7064 domain-containing protein n=1 Tax=Sphingomonas sp. MM-1 TaxID=745310 RepID=UPI0002C09C2B|nr:hypothetical protein [Sphingomonas sp. MM-1]AGH51796.1 hypothetical protein G432_20570 [Sphingomonas sp. MM-1]
MTELATKFEDFPAEHAGRHKLAQNGRESLAHIFLMPEYGMAGFLYPSMLGTGDARGMACFFGPGFPEQVEESHNGAIGDEMTFADWRLGPMRMAVTEPHEKVSISWAGERIKVSAEFEATHPPYAFSTHPRGNPPYFGDNRTEQHGRVTAQIEIDGRFFPHQGFMIRDHSWGPRIWGINQHYKWIHATTGDASMHFFEMQAFGKTELRGFLFKDGKMRHLVAVDYTFAFDNAMLQRDFCVTVTDSDGRQSAIDYDIFGTLQSSHDPKTVINTGCAKVRFDGIDGVGVCEFNWNRNYFDFAKDFAVQYG